MSCPYTFRCKQFKQWKEEDGNESALRQRVMDYITKHPHHPYELHLTPLARKNNAKTKDNEMKRYVCISDNEITLLNEEEITTQLLQGTMFDEIFELGRAMELQIRLVPAKKTKKTKSQTDDTDVDVDVDDDEEDEPIVGNGATKTKSKKKKSSRASAPN